MYGLRKLIQIVQEDIIGTDNRFIAIIWVGALGILLGLGVYLSSERMSFMGVADSRELQINFEYPVEIKRIHVLPGQRVSKGDLLVELNQSELNGRIRAARTALGKLESEMRVREHLNAIVNKDSSIEAGDPLAVDIVDLREEIEILESQKRNLYVFAEVDGIVGAVHFKRGEKVSAFTSLLTLSSESPSYVEGFVHESLGTQVEVGQRVGITSLHRDLGTVEGRVVSFGSRVVAMPPRMLYHPTMQAWGREVVVEIPPHNPLLVGEKVQIKPRFELLTFSRAMAAPDIHEPASAMPEPAPMELPRNFGLRFNFEPSGAVYLEDLKKFLVVSDDGDGDRHLNLFLVDKDGRVDDQTVRVPGAGEIDDIESISEANGWTYLLASQSLTKKGKDKRQRNLLVRARRSGLSMGSVQTIELKPLLVKALKSSGERRLQEAFAESWKELEIESHFVDRESLYLGFKQPKSLGSAIVVKIEDVEGLFLNKKIPSRNLSLWHEIRFDRVHGSAQQLTDLIRRGQSYYAATSCEDGVCGAVWKLEEVSGELVPELLRSFKSFRPEGLAYHSADDSLFVTFDQKDEARFTRIPLSVAGPKDHEL